MLDAFTLLSDAQALTATAVSTNCYDSGAAGNDINAGEPLALEMTVDVAVGGTSPTFSIAVVDDDNTSLSSPATILTVSLAAALLTAGAQFVIPIPKGLKVQRYLGANYTLGGTSPTITVTTAIKPLSMCEARAHYPDNIVIS